MYGEGHWMGGGFLGMGLFWLVLAVVIFLLLNLLLRGSGRQSKPEQKSPLEILKERYARGEIDQAEYEQKKHDLTEE